MVAIAYDGLVITPREVKGCVALGVDDLVSASGFDVNHDVVRKIMRTPLWSDPRPYILHPDQSIEIGGYR